MNYLHQMATMLITKTSEALREQLEAVWLACALDTEGSIVMHKNSHGSLQIELTIVNTHLGFANEAIAIIEGARLTARTHKYQYRAKNEKRVYYEVRTNALGSVEKILERVLPYLIIKREQAELALSYLQQHKYNTHEDSMYVASLIARMKALNSKAKNTLSEATL